MTKIQDLRAESSDELKVKLDALRSDNYAMRSSSDFESKGKKTHAVRRNRQDIARILTLLREREVEGQA